jgi:hypothetical protein
MREYQVRICERLRVKFPGLLGKSADGGRSGYGKNIGHLASPSISVRQRSS